MVPCLYYSTSDWLFKLTEATMGTNLFGYAYDPIGNRRRTGANSPTNFYAAKKSAGVRS